MASSSHTRCGPDFNSSAASYVPEKLPWSTPSQRISIVKTKSRSAGGWWHKSRV